MSRPKTADGFLASCRRYGIPAAAARKALLAQSENVQAVAEGRMTFEEAHEANRATVKRLRAVREMARAGAN